MSSIERLLAATHKGLFTVERGSGKWEVVEVSFEGDDVSALLPDARDGALYAAVHQRHAGNRLHRSDDGGRTFQELTTPAYPARPEHERRGEDDASTRLELIWSLEAGGSDRPGRLWAGTVPGGLFRSDDRGESWQLLPALWDRHEREQWFGAGGMARPGIHSVAVDPRDSDHLLLGVSCGGLWRTRDAGDSFSLVGEGLVATYVPEPRARELGVQDPHRVAQCRANPDVIWVQHRSGIFRSEDAGETFVALEAATPSSFGFAVAAHPHDPLTAWFVPLLSDERRIPVNRRLCVMQTRDGGRSFEPKFRGLPERFAYDLVYRHALDVDSSGTLLAFGSTSGNLWLSEDGGESFGCISHHLPPIHALRFATARLKSRGFEGRASVAPPPRGS
jgi:hypothetical protein